MSRTRVVIKNSILNVIYRCLSILTSFLCVRYTIDYLGELTYGIWLTILSIISWVDFFDIGIGNGVRNHLSRDLALKNLKSAREYVITSYVVISGISITLFLVLSFFLDFFNWNKLFNFYQLNSYEIKIILKINLLFLCINFILKLVHSMLYASQKSSLIGLLQLINQLLVLVGVISINKVAMNQNLLGMTLVYGGAGVLVNIMFTSIFFKNNKQLIPQINDFKVEKIKSINELGLKFFVIQLSVLVIFNTDNFIIIKLFGPEEVTPYGIVFKIFSLIILVHNIAITSLWSEITRASSEKDYCWIKQSLKRLKFFQILILIGSGILYFLLPTIVKIWLGLDYSKYNELILLFAIYSFVTTWAATHAVFFNGLGEVDYQLVVATIQGIINIPLSIYFAKSLGMGVNGVILGTIFSLLLGAITYPFKLKQILNTFQEN